MLENDILKSNSGFLKTETARNHLIPRGMYTRRYNREIRNISKTKHKKNNNTTLQMKSKKNKNKQD